MKHQKTLLGLALMASATTTSPAQDALIDRGNDLIYKEINA